jgi:hypothetical protein
MFHPIYVSGDANHAILMIANDWPDWPVSFAQLEAYCLELIAERHPLAIVKALTFQASARRWMPNGNPGMIEKRVIVEFMTEDEKSEFKSRRAIDAEMMPVIANVLV